MAIDKEITTYTFTFKIEDVEYKFSANATSRDEALKQIRTCLAVVISDINEQLKGVK